MGVGAGVGVGVGVDVNVCVYKHREVRSNFWPSGALQLPFC